MDSPKIHNVDALFHVREKLRSAGKRVVQCHGCFDIVHPGHVRYLRYAKSLGDALIVSITADRWIDKGVDRPYVSQDMRLENLAALEFVDYVCVDDHARAREILDRLKPDIYVKGKEYETQTDSRFAEEKRLVESYGGQIAFSSGDVVFSSTRIIERLGRIPPVERERISFFCRTHGITRDAVEQALSGTATPRILVIGDPILDHYLHCEETSIASESPVISVTPVEEQWFVGGAGLIAKQLAHLGAQVSLLTTLDGSPESVRLRRSLEEDGVDVFAIDTDMRPVFVKLRYLVDGQKLFKVNSGHRTPLPTAQIDAARKLLSDLVPKSDLMVIADFGYGLFGAALTDAIVDASSKHDVPYAVDVSRQGSSNLLKFKAPAIATPTEDELRFAFGDLESGLSNLASRYYQTTGADGLILTMDKRGAILFLKGEPDAPRLIAEFLPPLSSHPVDTVGAGDVFLSAVALCRALGESSQLGFYLGTVLAAMHVSELGNYPTSFAMLREYVLGRPELATPEVGAG